MDLYKITKKYEIYASYANGFFEKVGNGFIQVGGLTAGVILTDCWSVA